VADPADSSFSGGDAWSSYVVRRPLPPLTPRRGQPGHDHLHPSFTDEELQGEAPKLEEHPRFHQLIGRFSSIAPSSSVTPLSSPRLGELPSQRSCPTPSSWSIGALAIGLDITRRPLR
jgi:hypothetical protein